MESADGDVVLGGGAGHGSGGGEAAPGGVEDLKQRTSCVFCDVFQPSDAKFLRCLHVACAGCVLENTRRDGSVLCALCLRSTASTAHLSGVTLSRQLVDCQPFLYNVAKSQNEQRGDAAGVDTGKDSPEPAAGALCDICEYIDLERAASYKCCDCNGQPLCQQHADKHVKKRSFAGHRLTVLQVVLDSDTSSASQQQQQQENSTDSNGSSLKAERKCMYHTCCDVITFCTTCWVCVCQECLKSGHEGHTFESLAFKAAKQRKLLLGVMQSHVGVEQKRLAADTFEKCPRQEEAEGSLQFIASAIEGIEKESRKVSAVVTATFDRIEEAVNAERQRLLDDIDRHTWRRVDDLQVQRQHLELSRNSLATALAVARQLLSAESTSDSSVLQLAKDVQENLERLSEKLSEDCSHLETSGFRAVVRDLEPVFDRLRDAVELFFPPSSTTSLSSLTGSDISIALPGYRLRPRASETATLPSLDSSPPPTTVRSSSPWPFCVGETAEQHASPLPMLESPLLMLAQSASQIPATAPSSSTLQAPSHPWTRLLPLNSARAHSPPAKRGRPLGDVDAAPFRNNPGVQALNTGLPPYSGSFRFGGAQSPSPPTAPSFVQPGSSSLSRPSSSSLGPQAPNLRPAQSNSLFHTHFQSSNPPGPRTPSR